MRVFYEEMKEKLQSILVKHGFDEKRAEESAKNFADSSLDGVYSHGYQRFPRVIDYIQKGYIDVNAVPEKITGFGAVERWDGHLGMGNLNAKMAMQRAVELAAQLGIGMVAMSNTNHWDARRCLRMAGSGSRMYRNLLDKYLSKHAGMGSH